MLVTGGAGFIGSHLAEELLSQGHEVWVYDNLVAGYLKNVPKGCFMVNDDILNIDIHEELKNVDVIFNNAASKKNICLKDPVRDAEVNTIGTLKLLEFAYRNNIKKFVHASTGSVYGNTSSPLREWDKPAPVNYYGVSKANAENYVQFFNKKGLNTTILRYFHVYGKRQESDENLGGVVSIFIDKMRKGLPLVVHGDGTQNRSFTYVKDVVKANLLVVDKPISNGEIYNVGSGLKININYLITELRKQTGLEVQIAFGDRLEGDTDDFNVVNHKIKYLGLEFTRFSEGISLTI